MDADAAFIYFSAPFLGSSRGGLNPVNKIWKILCYYYNSFSLLNDFFGLLNLLAVLT
jgi:hypothetical protein